MQFSDRMDGLFVLIVLLIAYCVLCCVVFATTYIDAICEIVDWLIDLA